MSEQALPASRIQVSQSSPGGSCCSGLPQNFQSNSSSAASITDSSTRIDTRAVRRSNRDSRRCCRAEVIERSELGQDLDWVHRVTQKGGNADFSKREKKDQL